MTITFRLLTIGARIRPVARWMARNGIGVTLAGEPLTPVLTETQKAAIHKRASEIINNNEHI